MEKLNLGEQSDSLKEEGLLEEESTTKEEDSIFDEEDATGVFLDNDGKLKPYPRKLLLPYAMNLSKALDIPEDVVWTILLTGKVPEEFHCIFTM